VLVIVIVLLSISLTLFAVWAQRIVTKKFQLEMQQKRMQAIRLAEAGIDRARARRAVDSQFDRETWSVPATDLGQARFAGEVRIRIVPGAQEGTTRYEATAEFPAGELRRVQITKTLEVSQDNHPKQP
jgi:hypothetical protein